MNGINIVNLIAILYCCECHTVYCIGGIVTLAIVMGTSKCNMGVRPVYFWWIAPFNIVIIIYANLDTICKYLSLYHTRVVVNAMFLLLSRKDREVNALFTCCIIVARGKTPKKVVFLHVLKTKSEWVIKCFYSDEMFLQKNISKFQRRQSSISGNISR